MEDKMKEEFKLITNWVEDALRLMIKECQENKHIQQVAFSTYHNCLTQICFNCKKIRSSIDGEDLK